VPFGNRSNPIPWDNSKIITASNILKSADIKVGDFEKIVSSAKENDFIYFDPPYTVAHGNNGFVKYNSRIFTWDDQIRLSNIARDLARRGCKVIVSNADHPSIHALYRGFTFDIVNRHSRIAASSTFRRSISECIIYN
jgi:DNA adenine methylase